MNQNIMINAIRGEYKRYKIMAEKTIEQVDDVQLCTVIGDSSIVMYMTHLGGNFSSRFSNFLSSDGEKDDRNRDSEFKIDEITKESSLKIWHNGWSILNKTMEELSDDDLHKIVTIRKQELTVADALARSLSHVAYHVGEMVLLGKILLEGKWKSLSIPRNASKQYNANPNLEKIK